MRLSKIMLIILVLCGISVLSLSCASESTTVEGQVVTVQRGNLTTDITSVGNLALSYKVDLPFDIPSAFSSTKPITVEEVLVKAGDSVEKGQVLAKLDTSLWDDQVTALQRQVTQAEGTVTAKKLNKLLAQSNLKSAELALEQTEETSTDIVEIEIKKLQVEKAKGDLEAAQTAIEDAKTAVEDAKKALAQAKDASPEIKAPFAGLITNVNVAGGAEVKKGTVAVTLADPNKFEAEILVNEMNILKVKLGENATARLDAMTGISLPAKVTAITPSATIQSGVVNYKVKVEVQSLQAVMQARAQAGGGVSSANISFGGQQRQGQQLTRGNVSSANISSGRQQPQMLTTIPQDLQLKEGMTVTISIVMEQRNDVLMIPNGAITSRGGQTYVQVVLANSTSEQRTIQTGISNGQYTEVTSGLSEGEQVIVPKATTTTTTTSQQQRAPGGMAFFGTPPR